MSTYNMYVRIHIPAVCHGLLENILKTIVHTYRHHWKSMICPSKCLHFGYSHISSCLFSLQICFGSEWPTGVFAQDLETSCKKYMFLVTSSTLKGFQSTNSYKFHGISIPSKSRTVFSVHHYLSNFLDDLDHVLQSHLLPRFGTSNH